MAWAARLLGDSLQCGLHNGLRGGGMDILPGAKGVHMATSSPPVPPHMRNSIWEIESSETSILPGSADKAARRTRRPRSVRVGCSAGAKSLPVRSLLRPDAATVIRADFSQPGWAEHPHPHRLGRASARLCRRSRQYTGLADYFPDRSWRMCGARGG